MKLFLSSVDGIPPETKNDFLKLLDKDPKDTKICFIDTASDISEDKSYVKGDMDRLVELGFNIEKVDLKEENGSSLEKKLVNFDVVFMTGGNNFYLLKHVRNSGFDKAIRKFLDKGGVYFGCSAGAMIMGLSIESAQWKNPSRNTVGLKDLTGLKLVPFVISVHTDETNIELTRNCSSEVNYPVVALTDKQAIVVDGNKRKIVGTGKKIIFNTKEKL